MLGRVVAIMACAAIAATADAQQKPGAPKPAAPAAAAAKAPVFVIVTIGDHMQVMDKGEVPAKEKALAEEYTKAMQKYEKDKKAAEAAKKPFTRPAPTKSTVVVSPGDYPTKAAADAALKKMREEKEAKDKEGKGKGVAPAPGKGKGDAAGHGGTPAKGKH